MHMNPYSLTHLPHLIGCIQHVRDERVDDILRIRFVTHDIEQIQTTLTDGDIGILEGGLDHILDERMWGMVHIS